MGACYSNIHLMLDEDHNKSLHCQPDMKDNAFEVDQILIYDLNTQGEEPNQNLEDEPEDQNMIQELNHIEDYDKILIEENQLIAEELAEYEENIKYIETERQKLEIEIQNSIEIYLDESTQSLMKTDRKNHSVIELMETQSSKVSELTQDLKTYQVPNENFKDASMEIEQIKRAIQAYAEEIVREQQIPLNYILLSIKNNEGKILSLEAKYFKTMNYIRKLKESKFLVEFKAIQRDQSIYQMSQDRSQLQEDKEKYEQETLPEMRKNIKNLETELDTTQNSLKTAEKEIALLTSKFNQIDAGPYSIFIQDITRQLLAREKEVDVITSECNRLRKEYAEMSLNKEEIEEYLAIVPLQKLKLKELQEQLSSNIRDLEDTLSSKNDEIACMSLLNKKLGFNVDSMANSIEYQSVVILDLQKHLRDIEGFYLRLQKKLYKMLNSIQIEDSECLKISSKETLYFFTDGIKQLDKSIALDLEYISNATKNALDHMKYPQLFIDLDRDSVFTFSPRSDPECLLRFSNPTTERSDQYDLPSPLTLRPSLSLDIVIEGETHNSTVESISPFKEDSI